MKQGIYFNLPSDQYHADESVSNSALKRLETNPMEFWWYSWMNTNKKEETSSKSLLGGRAFHKHLLEKDTFDKEFDIKKGVKSSTAKAEDGRQYVGEGDMEVIKHAVGVIQSKPKVSNLFKGGYPEVSIFWIDEETGVPCRVRFDYLRPKVCVDYKTISSCTLKDCLKSIKNYGYRKQAAFYLRGLKTIKRLLKEGKAIIDKGGIDIPDEWIEDFINAGDHTRFIFTFQQSSYPCQSLSMVLEDDAIYTGEMEYRTLLRKYVSCFEMYGTEMWQDFDDSVLSISDMQVENFWAVNEQGE